MAQSQRECISANGADVADLAISKNIMSSFSHGNGAAFPESCRAHRPPHRLNWSWRRVWEQVRGEEPP